MNLDIDIDMEFLAAQTPPVQLFPTPNTSHLPYNEQAALLETEYTAYYEYRGDIQYRENMARNIEQSKEIKPNKRPRKYTDETDVEKDERRLIAGRISRDKKKFFTARIEDDNIILRQIFDAMLERTAEMELFLEGKLLENGHTELPVWNELLEDSNEEEEEEEEESEPLNVDVEAEPLHTEIMTDQSDAQMTIGSWDAPMIAEPLNVEIKTDLCKVQLMADQPNTQLMADQYPLIAAEPLDSQMLMKQFSSVWSSHFLVNENHMLNIL